MILIVILLSALMLYGCAGPRIPLAADQRLPLSEMPDQAQKPATPLLEQEGYPVYTPKPLPRTEAGFTIIYPKLGLKDSLVAYGPEDSVFVLGNVTDINGTLIICGDTIPIHPGGGWLAWVGYDQVKVVDSPGVWAEGRYGVVPIRYVAPSQELDGEMLDLKRTVYFRLADDVEAEEAAEQQPVIPFSGVISTHPTEWRDGVIRCTWPGAYDLFPVPGTLLYTDGYLPDFRDSSHRMYRVPLGDGDVGWIRDEFCEIDSGATLPEPPVIKVVRCDYEGRTTRIQVPVGCYRMPFRVERTADGMLALTLYGAKGWTDVLHQPVGSRVVDEVRWRQLDPATYQLRAFIHPEYLWGWDVTFEANYLVWTITEPPAFEMTKDQPLAGMTIVVDPGHGGYSTGAVGPTGISEKETLPVLANVIKEVLKNAGASVFLTKDDDRAMGLRERVQFAKDHQADLVLSVHYNAVGQGTNPMRHHGVSLHYNHRHSLEYAESLYRAICDYVGWEGNGIRFQDLAIPRLTSCPSVLIECGFMMHPEEEQLTVDPAFMQATAEGIRAGIIRFLWQERAHISQPCE